MEPRLSLITLGVADVARSRRFYEALGWRASGASQADVAFFQLGGIALSLWGRAELARDADLLDPGGWGGVALAHNVRTRAEVDAILGEARAAGRASGSRPTTRSGAGTPATSPTRTVTRGRSPGTRTSR